MNEQVVESKIIKQFNGIVNQKHNFHNLANFKIGGIVFQICSPFPEWEDSLSREVNPEFPMFQKRFQVLKNFLTDEAPQLMVKVMAYPKIKNLAKISWEIIPISLPGKQIKSFWQNGKCYIFQKNWMARYRKFDAEIEIIVPDKMSINHVDMAVRFILFLLITEKGGFILHSSGLVHSGKAFLFFGVSGSGKSTIAKLSKADAILSDEAVIIRKINKRWLAYGTPYSGTLESAWSNIVVDLAAFIKLSKAPYYRFSKMSGLNTLSEILKTVVTLDESDEHKIQNLDNVFEAIKDLPVYKLEFMPEPDVWPFVLNQLYDLWKA